MVEKKIRTTKKEATTPGVRKVTPIVEIVPDYGSCKVCNSKLVMLLIDSRAKVPDYALVCNNSECSQYRVVVRK